MISKFIIINIFQNKNHSNSEKNYDQLHRFDQTKLQNLSITLKITGNYSTRHSPTRKEVHSKKVVKV